MSRFALAFVWWNLGDNYLCRWYEVSHRGRCMVGRHMHLEHNYKYRHDDHEQIDDP